MNKITVLVVDDSAFMRKAIEGMLAKDPDIQVIGTAINGIEAIEKVKTLKPDVVTLDIEMPRMDGLTALEKIMAENPLPVIMVSSLTTEGAEATLKALDLGAVDFIPKDKSFASFGVLKIEDDLREKVKNFGRRKAFFARSMRKPMAPSGLTAPAAPMITRAAPKITSKKKLVVIGTSTGGPQSLQKVIPMLPADLGVPVLVVQHMPPNFTKSLAQRLDSLSKLHVLEAQGKEQLEPNTVYIAKGGIHMKLKKVGPHYYTELSPEPSNSLHIPSVDVTVASVAENIGRDALGVIMTGMGSDGMKGLQLLKLKGGNVIAQNEASCVVYGMPRAVVEANIHDEVVPLDEIYQRIVAYCK
ncbi:chemotaxis response regulator protein-glutamate methylesterase [Seleniivibrio sp.]|uniref:protein-glutamate methylesterase/protein-glutamine glutaminase n=1 Tax=Seleniivibrio sp. TaxID=2898801 RepID=UPI0025E8CB8E|nr:chemotaxis response regulator protein-glutamate methylesterase [Seleniivibrio sp.]MCD8553915.1 chemotaxis response regulator protein-glutamate methylesterase [Seleniivibrio sp.]